MKDEKKQLVRIVIAEDEAIIRLDLRESLEAEGYVVVGETGRGDEAIELARDLNPDVVILDIKMPGLTGIEAAKVISDEKIAAVLLLTAFSQRDLIQDASQAGALAYLVKPFQRSELVPSVELAIGRFKEISDLKEKNDALLENLETRKIVDRAKGTLMDQFALKERDAYRYLQKRAMEERLPMKEIALLILEDEA
ncbi:MAG: response regulator [Acidimicrobiales bacterium]|jgi:response regulator NasT|nr:response regulator [Acidimicrobiales bacterium]MDP6298919.1 response regulator [Acidimicrobiales bacterium]HJM27878.1 response regulator [Acidimicrobiales bacterium]HJM98437.1 response regulator [Acidimicrobiales bacterium]